MLTLDDASPIVIEFLILCQNETVPLKVGKIVLVAPLSILPSGEPLLILRTLILYAFNTYATIVHPKKCKNVLNIANFL